MKQKTVAKVIQEKYYSQKARDAMPDSDFAGPHDSFPIRTQQDVMNAARLLGHAADPAAVKAAIIRIAKRKGFSLPNEWESETKPKESATPTYVPKQRIARIKSYFLEDGAVSLNRRQYPKEAVDKLIQSAQVQLSDPNALPLTCYLSHDEADRDNMRSLTGKITAVAREGKKAYALIDIPDTSAGRDAVALMTGGYIRTQSLRASGAEMYHEPGWNYPLVGGSGLKLEGIDFTTSPGLPQVARITDVVLESHSPQSIHEIFTTDHSQLLLEQQEESFMEDIQEEGIAPVTSGVTVGMTNDNPRDEYSQRMYHAAPGASASDAAQSLSGVHDHIATAVGMDCAPGTMERSHSLHFLGITEAGAKLSAKNKAHLMAAHDGVAKHLGMECADGSKGNDNMQDGDDDDSKANQESLTRQQITTLVQEAVRGMLPQQQQPPQTKKEIKKTMTPEEAARFLQEAGYKIEAPKSEQELLKEGFEAQIAEQNQRMEALQAQQAAQFEEMKKLLTERQNPFSSLPPQRKSLVEGANVQEGPKRPYYRNGDYMREKLRDVTVREQLLDRSRPLPEDMNAEHLLKEFQLELLGMYDAAYGLTGNPKVFGN